MTELKWLSYCRITCIGGSANGECPCKRTEQCEMQGEPDYEHQVQSATQRIFQSINTEDMSPAFRRAINRRAGIKKGPLS